MARDEAGRRGIVGVKRMTGIGCASGFFITAKTGPRRPDASHGFRAFPTLPTQLGEIVDIREPRYSNVPKVVSHTSHKTHTDCQSSWGHITE